MPPRLNKWQLMLYRIVLPFRLRRQRIARQERAASALRGMA